MINIIEKSHQIKKVEIRAEQNTCSCGCSDQEYENVEETGYKQINQSFNEPKK